MVYKKLGAKMSKPNIIAVINQKGGVGKTTTVVNLASSYASLGNKVLVIDTDSQANATIGLGMEELINSKKNLNYALKNKLTLESIVAETNIPNLDIVASHPELDDTEESIVNSTKRDVWLEKFLSSEKTKEYQIIILDMHPSLKGFFIGCMKAAHYYLIPLFSEKYSSAGLKKQIKAAEEIREDLNPMLVALGALIVRYKPNREGHRAFKTLIEKIAQVSNFNVIRTSIPFSETVADAEAECLPLNIYTRSKGQPVAHAYTALAAEIAPKLKGKRIGRKMNPIKYEEIGEGPDPDFADIDRQHDTKRKVIKKKPKRIRKRSQEASL